MYILLQVYVLFYYQLHLQPHLRHRRPLLVHRLPPVLPGLHDLQKRHHHYIRVLGAGRYYRATAFHGLEPWTPS